MIVSEGDDEEENDDEVDEDGRSVDRDDGMRRRMRKFSGPSRTNQIGRCDGQSEIRLGKTYYKKKYSYFVPVTGRFPTIHECRPRQSDASESKRRRMSRRLEDVSSLSLSLPLFSRGGRRLLPLSRPSLVCWTGAD